ncbi:hypothetical protein C8J56DRAFT_886840 [Mycena floridula]|nr:hypothetical protein C8J56DRAFT_886840 [Mycena floridula]
MSLSHLLIALDNYFPRELTISRVLSVTATLISIYPLYRLHTNQRTERNQRERTGWLTAIHDLVKVSWTRSHTDDEFWMDEENHGPQEYTDCFCRDLAVVLDLLGLDNAQPDIAGKLSSSFYPKPRRILYLFHTLRRREKLQVVKLLDFDLTWVEADLCIAHCITCKADYLPDKVIYKDPAETCLQTFELDTEYFRILKNGIWVHKRIAIMQEKALLRFHAGWSNFAQWINVSLKLKPKITNRQSQDSGVLASSMHHGCLECMRWKRYREDLLAEGIILAPNSVGVAGIDGEVAVAPVQNEPEVQLPLTTLTQSSRVPGSHGWQEYGTSVRNAHWIFVPENLSTTEMADSVKNTSISTVSVVLCRVDSLFMHEELVLQIIKNIWINHPQSTLSFLVYDDACDLLHHIVTQEPQSLWVTGTKLIVDTWHYIGHQATDVLCQTRCSPAPLDGSQPDLVLARKDNNGHVLTTWAFNTETAEQFNSWLSRFEAQLKQMTARNYDVFMHVLFLLYKELREAEITGKGHKLTEEFWEIVEGLKEPEND